MSERITIDIHEHVADVRFNRPQRHNALDAEQFEAIYAAGASLRERQDVRAIVLSGNGPSFCSGLDFASFARPGQDLKLAFTMGAGAPANYAQRVAMVWRNQAVPVIAAVHGVAYGGGCQLALGADLRIARADSQWSIMEIEYGLIPDMAITQTLPPLVGLDVAMELSFTGRKLDGAQAQDLGLVTALAEQPLEHALELAATIAQRSPDAIRATKALFHKAWPVDSTLMAEEARVQQELLQQPNQAEAVLAKLHKRAPRFTD